MSPVRPGQFLGRMGMLLSDNEDPDAGAFRDRLDDIGARQRVRLGGLQPRDDQTIRHGDACCGHHHLGAVLLHRQRRRQHAGMAIGNAQNFHHTLNGSILAWAAMQQIERGIRLHFGQLRGDVPVHIDPRHTKACPLRRIGTGLAGAQRNLALGGPASHQNGDVLGHSELLTADSGPAPIHPVRVMN